MRPRVRHRITTPLTATIVTTAPFLGLLRSPLSDSHVRQYLALLRSPVSDPYARQFLALLPKPVTDTCVFRFIATPRMYVGVISHQHLSVFCISSISSSHAALIGLFPPAAFWRSYVSRFLAFAYVRQFLASYV